MKWLLNQNRWTQMQQDTVDYFDGETENRSKFNSELTKWGISTSFLPAQGPMSQNGSLLREAVCTNFLSAEHRVVSRTFQCYMTEQRRAHTQSGHFRENHHWKRTETSDSFFCCECLNMMHKCWAIGFKGLLHKLYFFPTSKTKSKKRNLTKNGYFFLWIQTVPAAATITMKIAEAYIIYKSTLKHHKS